MPKAVTIRKVDGKPGQVYYPYAPHHIHISLPHPINHSTMPKN